MSGFQGGSIFRCPSVRVAMIQSAHVSECLGVRCQDIQVSGIQVSGYPGVRLYRFRFRVSMCITRILYNGHPVLPPPPLPTRAEH